MTSNWLITINTNKDNRFISCDERQKFKYFCHWLFAGNNDKIPAIFDFISGPPGWEDKIEYIEPIKYEFEIGGNKHMLHVHCFLGITHSTRLKFCANKLRKVMRDIFGYNLHLDSPVTSNPTLAMKRYVKKTQQDDD